MKNSTDNSQIQPPAIPFRAVPYSSPPARAVTADVIVHNSYKAPSSISYTQHCVKEALSDYSVYLTDQEEAVVNSTTKPFAFIHLPYTSPLPQHLWALKTYARHTEFILPADTYWPLSMPELVTACCDKIQVVSQSDHLLFLKRGYPPEKLVYQPTPFPDSFFTLRTFRDRKILFGNKTRLNLTTISSNTGHPFKFNPAHRTIRTAIDPYKRKGLRNLLLALIELASDTSTIRTNPELLINIHLSDLTLPQAEQELLSKLLTIRNIPVYVTTHGPLDHDDYLTFLSESSIYVQPSHYEGFGIPPFFTLTQGIPTVAACFGGASDYLRPAINSEIESYFPIQCKPGINKHDYQVDVPWADFGPTEILCALKVAINQNPPIAEGNAKKIQSLIKDVIPYSPAAFQSKFAARAGLNKQRTHKIELEEFMGKFPIDHKLAVIIPHHCNYTELKRLLASISAQTKLPEQVILVANKPERDEGFTKSLIAKFTKFRLTCLTSAHRNQAHQLNVGIAATSKEITHFLALDSDTEMHNTDFIEILFNQYSDNTIAAGVLINGSNNRIDAAGGMIIWKHEKQIPDSLSTTHTIQSVDMIDCYLRDFDPAVLGHISYYFKVLCTPGANMFFSRAVYERTGGFDPMFEYYFVDTEFCLRAKALGISTEIIKSAKLKHYPHSFYGQIDRAVKDKAYQDSCNLYTLRANRLARKYPDLEFDTEQL